MTMTSAPDPRAVLAFARQMARKHMLLDLRSTGRKPRDADIRRMAGDYVAAHPELVALAKAMCEAIHQRELARQELLRQRRQQARVVKQQEFLCRC
jgi:hypothetical protein